MQFNVKAMNRAQITEVIITLLIRNNLLTLPDILKKAMIKRDLTDITICTKV